MTNTVDSFSDAFEILDQAIREQPRRELSAFVQNEVQALKNALAQEATASLCELSRGKNEFASLAHELSVIGSERSVEIANRLLMKLEVQIQETPMLVLGGFALAAFAVGLTASASVAHSGAYSGAHRSGV